MAPLIFITGASSGIGQALAWRFYQAGYTLALVARRTEDTAAWAQRQGLDAARYRVYGADVSVVDAIIAAGHQCIAAQGVPDVVIANAGISVGVDSVLPRGSGRHGAHFRHQQSGAGSYLPPVHRSDGGSAVPARWWASAAWPVSAVCPGTALIAPARRQ